MVSPFWVDMFFYATTLGLASLLIRLGQHVPEENEDLKKMAYLVGGFNFTIAIFYFGRAIYTAYYKGA